MAEWFWNVKHDILNALIQFLAKRAYLYASTLYTIIRHSHCSRREMMFYVEQMYDALEGQNERVS